MKVLSVGRRASFGQTHDVRAFTISLAPFHRPFVLHSHATHWMTAAASAPSHQLCNPINMMLRFAVETFPIWLPIREYIHQILSGSSACSCCVIIYFPVQCCSIHNSILTTQPFRAFEKLIFFWFFFKFYCWLFE